MLVVLLSANMDVFTFVDVYVPYNGTFCGHTNCVSWHYADSIELVLKEPDACHAARKECGSCEIKTGCLVSCQTSVSEGPR